MELARDAGAAGITMECVDHKNYSPAVCDVIRGFQAGFRKYRFHFRPEKGIIFPTHQKATGEPRK